MNYLERNKAIVAELKGIDINPGKVKDSGWGMNFVSCGSHLSMVLKEPLFLGLKRATPNISGRDIRDRFVFELGVVQAIASNLPHKLRELPAFMALVNGHRGDVIGILTEDFSKNSEFTVRSGGHIPDSIRPLFVPDSIDDDFFQAVSFVVEKKVPFGEGTKTVYNEHVLGDFYPLIKAEYRDLHKVKFQEPEIEEELDQHTIVL